jgi:hypothetical protein
LLRLVELAACIRHWTLNAVCICDLISVTATLYASVVSINGWLIFGNASTEVLQSFNVSASNAFCWAIPQANSWFFLASWVSGLAVSANLSTNLR